MQQSVQHAAADARQPVDPIPEREGERPARPDLDRTSTPDAPRRACSIASCLPITCTSTRNDRDAVIGNRSDDAAEPFLRCRATLRGDAALDQRDRRGAGDEPGGGRGGRLDRRQRGRGRPLDRPDLGEHGQPVDDLAVGFDPRLGRVLVCERLVIAATW